MIAVRHKLCCAKRGVRCGQAGIVLTCPTARTSQPGRVVLVDSEQVGDDRAVRGPDIFASPKEMHRTNDPAARVLPRIALVTVLQEHLNSSRVEQWRVGREVFLGSAAIHLERPEAEVDRGGDVTIIASLGSSTDRRAIVTVTVVAVPTMQRAYGCQRMCVLSSLEMPGGAIR